MFTALHTTFAQYSAQQKLQGELAAPNPKLRSDRILNYVWLNKRAMENQSYCAVPLHYLDKAFHNARLYADTEVDVWIDFAKIDANSRFIVERHTAINAPSNVRLKDLNDIPAYKNSSVFHDVQKPYSLATKVDLARFMVLSHGLKTTQADTVFYADFDLEDVELDNLRTKNVLREKGIAYASVKSSAVLGGRTIAHGYIAVARSGQKDLDGVLLPVLEDAALARENIFLALLDVTFGEANPLLRMELLEDVTTDVPIHPIGWKMPVPNSYVENGLCAPGFLSNASPAP